MEETVKFIYHNLMIYKVECLLLGNAHKMTMQAVVNVFTESEPFCVHLSKVNKLPYDIVQLRAQPLCPLLVQIHLSSL